MADPYFQFLTDVTTLQRLPHGIEMHAGTPRLRLEALAPGTFRVRFHQDGAPFDAEPFSYALAPEGRQPEAPGVQVAATDAEVRVRAGGFTAVAARRPLRLRFEDADGNVFAEDDYGIAWRNEKVQVWKAQHDDEYFYGLGEKAFELNRRGRLFRNWNTDFPAYGPDDDPLYKTFPFYIGLKRCADGKRRAYGVFFDNPYRSEFDFGGQAKGRTVFGADGGEFVYYVFFGPDVADVLARYTALTGRMPLPPRWALGYHQCRWSYFPEREVRTLAQQFRERRIPLDALYLDIHYMDGFRVFTWNRDRFPDPPAMIRDLKAQGIRTVVIVNPGVKVDPGYFVHDEGLEADVFVKYPDGAPCVGTVWPGACYFPDFTKPAVRQWFGRYYERLLRDGAAGFWNDMNEPSNGQARTLPDLALHDFDGRGGTHEEAHNLYGLLMARTTYEALRGQRPDERPFVITRAAYAGAQRYAAMWTGDNISTWEHLRLVLPMLLSLGLSGVPLAGSDIGGFFGTPTPELFARWMQLGAFSPLFRTHTIYESPRQEPWSFGPRIEEIARRFIELRYRLLPVFYTLFDEHHRTGLPPIRPLLVHYQQDERVLYASDQFLLGEAVLVAPVLHEGALSRRLYLPEGRWYDFRTGKRYEGPDDLLVPAGLDELPMFVKAGTTLPLGPVLQHTEERLVDELELRLYPGDGTSLLYEDDGRTHAYRRGDYRRTHFTLREDEPHTFSLTRRAEGGYASPLRRFVLHVHALAAPAGVAVDGAALAVARVATIEAPLEPPAAVYNEGTRTLLVYVDAGFEHIRFRIER